MEFSLFISLVVYACATTFSPGPNNVLLLSSAGAHGPRKCVPLLAGIWTGLITVMLICGFACSFLGNLVPQIAGYARIVGAAYIVYLGYKTLVRPVSSSESEGTALTYINGFLLQFLNVKILMLGIAAYCSFILPNDSSFLPTIIFSFTMAICAACGNLIWLLVGTIIFPVYHRYYRIFNVIMAALLFYCVYKILFV